MIRKWLCLIVCLFGSTHFSNSQNDYIATDSSLTSGLRLIQGTRADNAQFVRLKKTEVTYKPGELAEYGFKTKTVYISKNISLDGESSQVFLERLAQGEITLYYYEKPKLKTFFLERDSPTLIELEQTRYRAQLLEYASDFYWMSDQIKLAKYSRNSLTKLMSIHNDRIERHLPFLRFGLVAGYSSTKLIVPSDISVQQLWGLNFDPSSSFLVGVFTDIPIEMTDLSLNVGINYTQNGFSLRARTNDSDIDAIVNIKSIEIPFLLRYTWPMVNWRPFINIGGNFLGMIDNSNFLHESVIDQDRITINEVVTRPFVADNMLGFSLGAGIQYNLTYRKIISSEVRFTKYSGTKETVDMSQLLVLIGFSI